MNNPKIKFDASEESVAYAAEYCARALAKWFESEEEAAKAISEDPQAMVEIALADFLKTHRKLTSIALMKSNQFSNQLLASIRS